jgi:hypothetical protein
MIWKHLTAILLAVVSAGSISSGVAARPPATPDADAKQWLLYIDGGDYTKGWVRAGSPFKAQITASVLQSKISPTREPLGAILQRTLSHVTYSNTAPGLPDGKYAVVEYNSRFANGSALDETVWLDFEDGHWLVIAYFIDPNAAKADARSAPALDGKICSHEELVQARIARMNGYRDGPSCGNGP